jgi:hypothetical protein
MAHPQYAEAREARLATAALREELEEAARPDHARPLAERGRLRASAVVPTGREVRFKIVGMAPLHVDGGGRV